ncbi:hypothetical protein GW17_00012334 [Ensete ventricosum]|nr:hypothetical protein GW17_00012334 [Ensete ventricosum]
MAWRLLRVLQRTSFSVTTISLPNPNCSRLYPPAASSPLLPKLWKRSHTDAAPLPSSTQETRAGTESGDSGDATSTSFRSSLNEAEVAKFAAIADTWSIPYSFRHYYRLFLKILNSISVPLPTAAWDSQGPFQPLHLMNPTRISFIRSTLCRYFRSVKRVTFTSGVRKDPFSARPFEGLKIVDVGCGGGILSEPLARMGATVTGIDAVEKNIKIAQIHAVCSTPLWLQ